MGNILKKKYLNNIQNIMRDLSKKNKSIFIGQSVSYPGNLIYKSLLKVPNSKKFEVPVFEDHQMGISTGLALAGYLPITTFPRFDFFILSLNQLVNHLDKIKVISKNNFKPKVIVRVLVGSKKPLDAGHQHTNNYVNEIKKICKFTKVYDLKNNKSVLESYKNAIESEDSSILVEYSELYEKI
jgi:pyruvate/2-oxoglutarate/acetoin dehydrogenase E1 component